MSTTERFTAVRTVVNRFPFRRTALDVFLALFLVTAALGVWVASDREVAWLKFVVILGSVLLYYLLAGQPQEKLWPVTALISGAGVIIAVHFLLMHDWVAGTTGIGSLDRIALSWMSIRPIFPYQSFHPNIAGGLVASLVPFQVALGIRAWHKQETILLLVTLFMVVISLAGLLLTASRGAMLALALALGLWLLWTISRPFALAFNRRREAIFVLVILFLAALFLALIVTHPGGPLGLAANLPGPAHAPSRLELAINTVHLASDFPFTGGGLSAFAGLYSHYILVIPFFFFNYSHNFYLDVLLEQGLFGLLALLGLLLGSGWLLLRPRSGSRQFPQAGPLRWAIFASLIVVCVHGFVDSALYANQGVPLLFVWAGMAVAVSDSGRDRGQRIAGRRETGRHCLYWLPGVIVLTIILAFLFHRPLSAQWYANLGAVEMAQVELAGWPHDEWDDGRYLPHLERAEAYFLQALRLNGANRTAHHRLGLMAMMRRDYTTAVTHLETAHHLNRKHRGIVKNLGYSYAWAGNLDQAAALLVNLPESRQEMDVYSWWWTTQGRDDLSALAAQMATRLNRPGMQ